MRRKIIQNRKAQSHVEMILSFVIFIGFLVALFVILNPLKPRHLSQTNLDITESSLIKNWTASYTIVSLTLKSGVDPGIDFSVDNSLNLNGNLFAKDEIGDYVQASIFPSTKINIDHKPENRHYKLYVSDVFDFSSFSSSTPLSSGEYTFGAINSGEAILFESIEQTIEKYNEDYDGLRQELNLNNDFAFFVYDLEGSLVLNATRFIPQVVEVNAKDIPIVTINKTAGQENLVLNLQVW